MFRSVNSERTMKNRMTDEEWESIISNSGSDAEKNNSSDFYETKLIRNTVKKRNKELSEERKNVDVRKLNEIQNQLILQGLVKEDRKSRLKRYIRRNYGGFGAGIFLMYIASALFSTQNIAYRGEEVQVSENKEYKIEIKSYKYLAEINSENPKIDATLLVNEVLNMNKVSIVAPKEDGVEIYVAEMSKNPGIAEIKFKEGLSIPIKIEGTVKIKIKKNEN